MKQLKSTALSARRTGLANEQPPFDFNARAPYSIDVMYIQS